MKRRTEGRGWRRVTRQVLRGVVARIEAAERLLFRRQLRAQQRRPRR